MDAVEKVVAQIQGLSGSAADLGQLHHVLKQSEDLLRSNSSRLGPFLDHLDPSIHSLGFLYFLYALTFFKFFFGIFEGGMLCEFCPLATENNGLQLHC